MTAPAGRATEETRRWFLLVLLVLMWAVAWPVIKLGVTAVPPIWYAALRYVIATVCLFAVAAGRGALVWPAAEDWVLIGVSGALQMAAYSALTGLALTRLPPGRASVLAFATPLWVVPLAAWRLREHVMPRARIGVTLGLAGLLVIGAPSFRAHAAGAMIAYVLLLAASAAWAVSIVCVRGHRFDASALALAPWQAMVAAMLLVPLAWAVEGRPPPLGWQGIASLAYVGPVATAFAYWAVVEAGRHYPASTMAMALLVTPAVGLVMSAITLGETVDPPLLLGLVLVGAGIRLATMDAPARTGGRATALPQAMFVLPRWALVPLRLVVGFGFLAHGWAKWSRGPAGFAALLAQIGAPLPHLTAWVVTLTELVGGVALMLGALVTVVSVPLIVSMLVAMFTVQLRFGFSSVNTIGLKPDGPVFGPPGYEINVLYMGALLALALSQPSAWSVDEWRARRRLSRVFLRPARDTGQGTAASAPSASAHR